MKGFPRIFLALRILTGGVFVYSGYSHLMAADYSLIGVILSYKIVGLKAAAWIAAVLPWTEFIAGVFLILGLWLRQALLVLQGLSAVFMIAILSTLLRGVPLKDCGCFGEGVHIPPQATLALDIILFLIFYWMHRKKEEAGRFGLDRFLG